MDDCWCIEDHREFSGILNTKNKNKSKNGLIVRSADSNENAKGFNLFGDNSGNLVLPEVEIVFDTDVGSCSLLYHMKVG